MREGFADLLLVWVSVGSRQFDDTIVGGDIHDTTSELVSELSQGLEVLVFMS